MLDRPLAALALALLLAACAGPAKEPVVESGPPVESEDLHLMLSSCPAGFEVRDASTLHLVSAEDPKVELWVERDPDARNLVDTVNAWKDRYEALPDGQFFGQLELGSHYGTTFTVRGRYTHEGTAMEERRIFALVPDLMGGEVTMVLRYPADQDTKARTEEMFGYFGLVEMVDEPPLG